MSLYTDYRPRDWDSVIGQDAISTVLRTSLIQNRVGHAYILTGSRGTGKTTTARILAKGVNCLDLQDGNPCHKCTHCIAFDDGTMLDCIEIDGASNNGVENVRDLIEKARFEPNQGKYKIYIIDEVHMLSTGAFNALLKTLEEPPKHVKFILATTEIDKVPETIRSRSLRFDFKKISEADIVKRLQYVCGEEQIQADIEALQIIAKAARGGLRDALTLTEQNTVNGVISTDYVRSTLSLIEDSLIDEIIQAITDTDKTQMITILDTLRTRHAEVRGLFDQILYRLRDHMILSFQGKNKTNTTSFTEYSDIFAIFESAYSRIKSIPDGWLLIEITLLRAVARGDMAYKHHESKDSSLLGKKEGTQRGLGEGTGGVRGEKDKGGAERTHPNGISNATELQRGSFSSPNSFDTFSTKSMEVSASEEIESQKNEQIPTGGQNKKEIKKEEKVEDLETNSGGQDKKETRKEEKLETSSSSFSYTRLLEEVKKTKATLVLDLKTARFELKDTHITLIFSNEWHYNRANTPAMKNIISETLGNLYSGIWTIVCRLEGGIGNNIADGVF